MSRRAGTERAHARQPLRTAPGPARLEHAHRRLDDDVSATYGFPADIPDKETLAHLLALNLERSSGAGE